LYCTYCVHLMYQLENNTMDKKSIRIELIPGDKKALVSLALNDDRPLKTFIERQLVSMGAKGISYLDLWQQCEALTAQLKQLSNQ